MPITLDGTLGITTPALTVTGASIYTGGLTTAGNLTFSSTGQRIIGDFSNATVANRLAFQNSITNSGTNINALPNGTALGSFWNAFGNSDPTNAAYSQIGTTAGTEVTWRSSITGTGTYLPMTFHTGGSERMRIDTSGNVGIGTSSPSEKLTVVGNILTNAGSTFYSLGRLYIRSGSGQPLDFGANNTNSLMQLDTAGNLGIGITSPAAKLDILGPSAGSTPYLSKAIQFAPSNFPTRTWSFNYDDGGAVGNGFNISAGSTKILYLNATGNVGIGTASPATKLEIDGTGELLRFDSAANQSKQIYLRNVGSGTATINTDGTLAIGSNDVYPILFKTSDTERMRITSGGYLLVGTTSPQFLYSGASVINSCAIGAIGGGYDCLTLFDSAVGQPTLNFAAPNSASNLYRAASVRGFLTTTTAGSEASALAFYTVSGGSNIVERMRISAAGYVTTPYRPAFFAHVTSAGGYTSVAQDTPLPADTAIYNNGSFYNTSTYRFTAPVTGLYLFTFSALSGNTGSTTRPMFYVNGSSSFNGAKPGIGNVDGNGSNSNTTSCLIYLSANDYVFLASQSGSLYFYGSSHSSFTGCLIG